jgi:hypothetical protein
MIRTMAVSTVTPLPPSQPDISKLNTYTGHTVTVTKHLGPRNTVGTMVVPTQPMSLKQILELQSSIPLNHGPGFYHFTVVDTGGTGEVAWMIKLGPDVPYAQEFPMAGSTGAPPNGFTGAPAVPMDATAVTQILPGWYYNSQMGLLYTPWRETVAWNTGDPLPKPPAQAAHLSLVPPVPNTPWGQQAPMMGGWGGYPVADDSKETIKRLETKIAEDARAREMEALRADQRRQTDETNARMEKNQQQFMTMFEKLMSTISDKPRGESPELLAIKAQNEALQRRLDDEKREREAERRDAMTREEMRRMKEDTDRAIRELNVNKADPMLPMLMQVIGQMNTGAMEAVKAIQASTSAANTSAERQVQALAEQLRGTIINPMQMMQMMQTAKGDSSEMSRMVLDTTTRMMEAQRGMYDQLLEVASQGGDPPWIRAIETIADKASSVGTAIAQQRAQTQQQQPTRVIRVPVDAQGNPIRITPAPAPAPTAITGAPGVAPAPASTAPTEIRNTPPAEAPATAAAPAKKKGRKTKGGKRKGPTAEASKIPAGEGPGGSLTIAQIRKLDPDVLAEQMAKFSDNVFFGDKLGVYVAQIRQRVVSGAATAEQLAEFLLQQRNFFGSLDPIPMAVELFMAAQIDVLIDRMLPEASDEFREKVVTIIEYTLEAEDAGKDEE